MRLLEREAREYERGAREFRDTITKIVRHHYETKRRRVLNALDREIGIEKKSLTRARDEAIARLEKFVATYSGANADPSATPDAMFRLAALYEERGREDFDADLSKQLAPAIDLYRRIIHEYPRYSEIAAVHYFLGHAYTDVGRLEEGQQAWRALVCANRFGVRQNPRDANAIAVQPLEQDQTEKFWGDWYNAHPVPLDAGAIGGGRRVDVASAPPEEQLTFRDPYVGCDPLPQDTHPGEEPRYLAEIWWQLGNFHFDQIDPSGGPYNLNRAVSAYEHGMEFRRPPLLGVTMYKLAWTFFKQQRYERAVEEFVRLLEYADEQEARTGDPGADFRSEAYTYIAGSLTYVDFEGPPPNHPSIPRNDVLDVEQNPLVAEEKMSIGIQRVQNPNLLPQDRKWSVEIYKSLAQEYIEITQNRNAIATLELTLERFPMDRDAPVIANKTAELYEQLSRLAPEGSAQREEYAGKALAARTRLKDYVGITAWTDANKGDPEALRQAEQLATEGLKRAAADHTNFARAFFNRAAEISDEGEQRGLLERALAEYRLAGESWRAYYEQDPNALDSYESMFWLADARYWLVVLEVTLGRTPKLEDVRAANEAAVAVRDSNQDDKYLQPAAFYLVSMADKVLEDQFRLFGESGGRLGIERRAELSFEGQGDERRVVRVPIPPEVTATMEARDAYNARVPVDRDPERNGPTYAFQVADTYFTYGDFAKARERFRPIYAQNCGRNEWGFRAWEKLIAMAAQENDIDESRKLAEARSCAVTPEQEQAQRDLKDPLFKTIAYLDAAKVFKEAQQMPDGPERDKRWRQAAAAYKVALEKAPDRDEAAEAAINGAHAYKQVGEYDKAIEMYELFISKYGDGPTLAKLRDGDPDATPPAQPNRQRYEERVKYLEIAYNALANANVLFFNYPRAAETFEQISEISHFEQGKRREAAQQALSLYTSLGDQSGMNRARKRFALLGASPREMAEADFIYASAELKKWDQYSPDKGVNAAARRRAQLAMEEYYARKKNDPGATLYVVHAAYWAAKMRHTAGASDGEKWWKNTVEAYERHKRTSQGDSAAQREAAMAAEAEFTMLDEQIAREFDYEAGHHRYKGTAVEVVAAYRRDAAVARQWNDKLQRVIEVYVSPEWTIAALSRQGSLFDSLRTGLYSTRPPALQMFEKKTERLLKQAEESGNPDLQEKADALRVKVQTAWRDTRDKELNAADEIMVARYANAVALARRYSVTNPAVGRAVRRLAFFTDIIGEAKMRQFAGGIEGLAYTEGMFVRTRPGVVTTPKPDGLPRPLPVMVQP